MPIWLKKMVQTVQRVNSAMSHTVSYLIIVITLTVSIEVIGRYVFNHPTSWVWPVNRQLFGIFILVALAYTQSQKGHIQIEIFYDRFPPALKTGAKWFAFLISLIFVGVLVWQTSIMAVNAVVAKERASGAFKIPLFPFKVLIPIASLMLGIEVIVSFFQKEEKEDKHD